MATIKTKSKTYQVVHPEQVGGAVEYVINHNQGVICSKVSATSSVGWFTDGYTSTYFHGIAWNNPSFANENLNTERVIIGRIGRVFPNYNIRLILEWF